MQNLKSEWIIPFQPLSKPQLRLFCFANAGGSPAQFRTWQGQLPEDVEVCPIQLPGQGSRFREQPHTRVSSLIENLMEAITPSLDVPYAFWGYSMGSIIAFELARSLKASGYAAPTQLYIAARRAPHVTPRDTPIHALPETAFIEAIQTRYNGIPAAVLQEPDLLALFLPVLRANFELIETHDYQSEDLLDCPVLAFGGLSDPTVNSAEINAWGELTHNTFQYFMFPGDHFFVQNHQPAILQILSKNIVQSLT